LQQRIYTRIAIAFTERLPRLQEESFLLSMRTVCRSDLLTAPRCHGGRICSM